MTGNNGHGRRSHAADGGAGAARDTLPAGMGGAPHASRHLDYSIQYHQSAGSGGVTRGSGAAVGVNWWRA